MHVDVGAAADVPPGAMRLVTVNRRQLGILNWNGRYFAIRNSCPHQLGPVAAGRVSVKLVAGEAVGRLDVDETTPVIACPWHGWEFDLRSGRSVADPQYRVAVYPVSVVGERLMVEVTG